MSNLPATQTENRLTSLLKTPAIRNRFEEVLGKRAPAFISSIVSAYNGNASLKKCEPMSVISAAAIAATLDLPINPALGFAHIVPYGDTAQFQMGWKGFVQLALRTGKYETINASVVFDGELVRRDRFTGEVVLDESKKSSDKKVGYLLYFKLLNGYFKYFYMTAEEVETHGKRYSKSYAKGSGRWVEDFDAMALKTVTKLGLSKWGILSVEMQKAFESDEAEIQEGEVVSYPDNPKDEPSPAPKNGPSRLREAIEATEEAPI